MKIVLVGATGMIGQAIVKELAEHQVIQVGNSKGDYQVDIEDRASVSALFEKLGKVDAIISTAGQIVFSAFNEMDFEQVKMTVDSKIMGNMNLFQIGSQYIHQGGSFTFTTGYLAQNPMPGSTTISMVNAALDAFAKAAALEFGSDLRVNTVSPRFVKETMELMGMDSSTGVPVADTAKAYRHAIASDESGQAFDVVDYI